MVMLAALITFWLATLCNINAFNLPVKFTSALQERKNVRFAQTRTARSLSSATEEDDRVGFATPNQLPVIPEDSLFCNVELNMNQIKAVGFDMDYTLAQYTNEFDLLAYNGAKSKLIEWMGYPAQIDSLRYGPDITRRGCLIDKKRGNILKLDQHRYVTGVEHGLTALSRDDRKSVYRSSYQDTARFTGSGFSNIDTPFSLVDACLFAQLVDLKDTLAAAAQVQLPAETTEAAESHKEDAANRALLSKSYAEVWNDLRICVGRCHCDGAIKLRVAEDPDKYIIYDPQVFPMLSDLRRAGKKVFLLTNSLFDYTQVVMSHMFTSYLQDASAQSHAKEKTWMDYFDLIIAGGNKPAFLLDEGSLTLYKVNPDDNTLSNCGPPPQDAEQGARFLETHGKVYQGGNAQILHHLLQISPKTSPDRAPERPSVLAPTTPAELATGCDEGEAGSEVTVETLSNAGKDGGEGVLYVGDHIFTDVLRSKRSLGWRTCLIVPEMSSELQALNLARGGRADAPERQTESERVEDNADVADQQRIRDELLALREKQARLENELDRVQCTHHASGEETTETFKEECQKRTEELHQVRAEINAALAAHDAAFHPRWGQLFRAGFQESRISKQIKDYACIYTSKASNLAGVSHMRPLRPARDLMPHDHFVAGLE